LRPRRDLGDAPCVATLVLDPESIPGFQGVLAGKLSGNLPAGGGELRLDAQGLRLDPEAPEEGVVTVTVDGVEHAFRLLTLFARQGEPTSPILDRSPRLRLRLLPPPNPGRSIAFTAAADRAPAGSRLEVRLLRTPDGPSAAPDRAQTFALPRQESAEMTVQPGGALLVKATVRDWQVTWDLPSLVGRRELQLRLLAADGSELLTESLPVVLDVTGPEAVRFLDLPERAKKGEPLRVRVTGRDPASGVRAVSIFLGKPVNDRPPPNVTPVAAQPSKGDPGVWEAEVPLPADRTGPTDLTAQFVNGAGLSSFASGSVELVNELPPATGSVEGTLLEGSIPQGGLEVQLLTDAGKPIRTTKTDANGRFRFDGITPGKYRLAATKQAAVTRNASAPVEVQAGKTTPVELSLYL
ncbi:MAG TPA: carboxypeptidase-like regulatory domain-containing protein, partial [Gemmataceae bacterium]